MFDGECFGDFFDGFLQGICLVFIEGGCQSMMISMCCFDVCCFGVMIVLFECVVGFYGELVNINVYYQFGVEVGKKVVVVIFDF